MQTAKAETAAAPVSGGFSSITPSFVLLSVALCIWSASVSLSTYLSQGFAREHHAARGNVEPASTIPASTIPASSAPAENAQTIDQLRKAVETDPQSADAHVALGYALFQQAHETRDNQVLMEAVQHLGQAVAIDPNHSEALRGMAALSLQAGVIDKAVEFYKRYLGVNPGDLRVKTDYALALIEGKEFAEADKVLAEVLSADPSHIAAQMTIAYRLKVSGDLAGARARALQAKAGAKEDRDKQGIDAFIAALDQPVAESPPGDPSGAPSVTAETGVPTEKQGHISPASMVDKYFRQHSIVGPKVRTINWTSASEVSVAVENFPVEQMPPFAREQFTRKTTEHFAVLPEPITIRLVDSTSSRELLVIPAGKNPAR